MTLSDRCWLRLPRSHFCLLWTCGSSSKEFFHFVCLIVINCKSRWAGVWKQTWCVTYFCAPIIFRHMQNQNLMKSSVVLFKCLATMCTSNNLRRRKSWVWFYTCNFYLPALSQNTFKTCFIWENELSCNKTTTTTKIKFELKMLRAT